MYIVYTFESWDRWKYDIHATLHYAGRHELELNNVETMYIEIIIADRDII